MFLATKCHTVLFAVCLQTYDFDPAEKNKHKFMVQTVIAPDDDDDEYPIDVVSVVS